jgi:hypothetical protein
MGRFPAVAVVLAVSLSVGGAVHPQTFKGDEPPCSDPVYQRLDFWVGEWEVRNPEGKLQGTNRIERTLGTCALREHWTSVAGGEGESLFYYYRPETRWKQVWVTAAGFVKEKAEVEGYEGPGVRFQGEVTYPGRGVVLDRTTLTPEEGGRVRQVIEVSDDGGGSWRTTFEGIYVPRTVPEERPAQGDESEPTES